MTITGEYILCAAIWIKDGNRHEHQPINVEQGIVVCGQRHHNCLTTAFILLGGNRPATDERIAQGFLTSWNRFVDRAEGGKIAFDSGQISDQTDCLFSEDLY
jgi:hypothetical protein